MPVSARSITLLLLFILLMPIVLILIAIGLIPLTPPIILLLSLCFFMPLAYLLRKLAGISEDILRDAGYSISARILIIYVPTALYFASLTILDINQFARVVFDNPALVVTIAFTIAMMNVLRLLLHFFQDVRFALPLFARGSQLISLALTTFVLLIYNLFVFASVAIAWAPYAFSYAGALNSLRYFLDMLALATLPWMMGLRILPLATTADTVGIVGASLLHAVFFIMLFAGARVQRQPGTLRIKGMNIRPKPYSSAESSSSQPTSLVQEPPRTESEKASTTTSR